MIDLTQRPLSFSSLSEFDKSPVHYINYITKQKKETPQMLLGSLVHAMILEPKSVNDRYIKMPKYDMRKPADKEAKLKFEADNAFMKVIDPDVWQDAKDIADAVLEPKKAKSVLSHLKKYEERFLMERNGLNVTGFIDGIGEMNGSPFILEVKTSQTSNPSEVVKDFYNKRYYMQAGIYSEALKVSLGVDNVPVVYIVVENKAPYIVSVFMATDEYIAHGVKEFDRLINEFSSWKDLEYPTAGYSRDGQEQIYELGLPLWAK